MSIKQLLVLTLYVLMILLFAAISVICAVILAILLVPAVCWFLVLLTLSWLEDIMERC